MSSSVGVHWTMAFILICRVVRLRLLRIFFRLTSFSGLAAAEFRPIRVELLAAVAVVEPAAVVHVALGVELLAALQTNGKCQLNLIFSVMLTVPENAATV